MKRARGFSMVELMVAIMLAMLVTGAVISVFVGSRRAFQSTSGSAALSDGGRFAVNFLEQAVRNAGFMACNTTQRQASILNVALPSLAYDFTEPLAGYEANGTGVGGAYTLVAPTVATAAVSADPSTGDWVNVLDPALAGMVVQNNDVLVVRSTLPGSQTAYATTPAPNGTASFSVNSTAGFAVGGLAVMSDCAKSAAFQIGGVAGTTISFNTGRDSRQHRNGARYGFRSRRPGHARHDGRMVHRPGRRRRQRTLLLHLERRRRISEQRPEQRRDRNGAGHRGDADSLWARYHGYSDRQPVRDRGSSAEFQFGHERQDRRARGERAWVGKHSAGSPHLQPARNDRDRTARFARPSGVRDHGRRTQRLVMSGIAMKKRLEAFPIRSKQSGVVLFVALILLLILSLIGVTAARMETVEERMARNDDNHQIGMEAAEAALRAAEGGILSGIYSDFSANANGLYTFNTTTGSSSVPANWSTTAGAALPAYAGPSLSAVQLAQAPQAVIESLPPVAVPGESISSVQYASPTPPVTVYRVSASAVGADGTSTTTLQSIFR